MQDKTVSFKLSERLLEKLEKRAAAEGKSRSRVIKDALEMHLSDGSNRYVTMHELEERLSRIERK